MDFGRMKPDFELFVIGMECIMDPSADFGSLQQVRTDEGV